MPIDPEYPLERIHYMLEDSGAKLCLVENEHERIGAGLPVACLGIEEERKRRADSGPLIRSSSIGRRI